MSASAATRGLRAAVFAAMCVLLAVAGHGLGTDVVPPWWACGAGWLAVFGFGWALGGRERSLPGIGGAMLGVQAALHLAFDAVVRPSVPAATARTASPPDRGIDTAHATAGPTGASAHLHALPAHLLAALVAAWWLRRGEAALWSLLRRTAALVPGLFAWWRCAPLPTPAGRALRAMAGPGRALRPALRHAVSRRGPPTPLPYPI
ncbi:hypothetical protein [Streptomyces sp. NK08204]|uniref:hypothetical protein n=1 Tax=Streptomyces sp. NK08204 TaxID=2873260 RepID=UPI001CEDBD04|nr:hypothetical protein [Streptomyces sp. NK08204]